MRLSYGLVMVAAVLGMVVVWVAGQALLQPDLPLITYAEFSLDEITPNADGEDDITTLTYGLSGNAQVSLALESPGGDVYYFRQDEPRIADDYAVAFSGVVDGYVREGEDIAGEVLRRLIPNDTYTWRLTAVNTETGEQDEHTGTLTVRDADSSLPQISSFTVWPDVFTPNQDGIADRTEVNVFLEKGADLKVYLLGDDGRQYFMAPRQEGRKPGEAGRHLYDYEGGVDLGADPPPDGTYTVVARAQDDEGQIVQQSSQLTIRNGGKPLAEIVPQAVGVDVVFAVQPYDPRYETTVESVGDLVDPPDNIQDTSLTALTVPLGDMLVFKLTVENYSQVPLRTSGPPPGTVYQQMQRAASLDWFDESGAWRVGIDCTTAETDYPWRWAIGTDDDLYEEFDPVSGNTYHYLPPGEQVVVWGAIRMTELEARNPQNCWAGLIHEDVEVSLRNTNVGSREVELVEPPA